MVHVRIWTLQILCLPTVHKGWKTSVHAVQSHCWGNRPLDLNWKHDEIYKHVEIKYKDHAWTFHLMAERKALLFSCQWQTSMNTQQAEGYNKSRGERTQQLRPSPFFYSPSIKQDLMYCWSVQKYSHHVRTLKS